MRNIIIGLVIGILLNGLITYAKETIVTNPITGLGKVGYVELYTTKVTTSEGTYRLFITSSTTGGSGITTVKIK